MWEWTHLTQFWKKPKPEVQKETVVIDMMKDDVDPAELTIENAYKNCINCYIFIAGN